MADITACKGQALVEEASGLVRTCVRRETCHRYTVQLTTWSEEHQKWRQSRFMGIPLKIVDGVQECEYYWPVVEK